MKAAKFLAAFALCLTATIAQAAGFRLLEVPADADGPALSGAMWYPCPEPPSEIDLGPMTLRGAKDCPISGTKLPLIVVSHGNLGAFFDHYDTAETLAGSGFVVAAISHRGDNSPPNFPDGADPSVMIERPGDIKRLINFMVGASPAASNIDPERIGFFGFSAGGYTGLVLTGADPDWAAVLCRFSSVFRACRRILTKEFRAQPLAPETRIKAAVIADPGPDVSLRANGFAAVKVPIQLWASETGGHGLPHIAVTPEGVAAIDRGLAVKHEYHVVPNAGHFAFLLCGPSIKAVPEFCTDAPGFDRVVFHKQFNADVLKFFRAQLGSRQIDHKARD